MKRLAHARVHLLIGLNILAFVRTHLVNVVQEMVNLHDQAFAMPMSTVSFGSVVRRAGMVGLRALVLFAQHTDENILCVA